MCIPQLSISNLLFGKKNFAHKWHIKLPHNACYCILENKENLLTCTLLPPLLRIISFMIFTVMIVGDDTPSWLGDLR